MSWDGVQTRTYWQPPVYFVLQAAWMKVMGLNLFAMRSLSVIAGIVALLLWRSVGRSLGLDRRVLVLAAVFFATDYTIIYSAANARMDMLSATFGVAALAIYTRLREMRFDAAIFWSQSALVLSGLTHPVGGMLAAIAFTCLFISYTDWRRLHPRTVLLACVPYLAGAAGWGAYILQDPHSFYSQFMGSTRGRLQAVWPWSAVGREIRDRYLDTFGWRDTATSLTRWKLFIPAAYLAGLVTVLATPGLRRIPGMRRILLLLGAVFLGLTYLDSFRFGSYLVHVIPLFLICLAAAVIWAWDRGGLVRAGAACFAFAFVILQTGGSLYWILKDPYRREYLPAASFVQTHVAPGELVMGGAELVFELGWQAHLLDDVCLGYFSGESPGLIVVDGRYQIWFQSFHKSDPALDRFIQRRLASEFSPVFHNGAFTVYRRGASPQ